MGWCSATFIFDKVADYVANKHSGDFTQEEITVLVYLGRSLQDEDWDCEHDSDYINDARFAEVWNQLGVYKDQHE